MSDKQFSLLWSEALASDDCEAFVSDWALSSIWGDDPESDIPGDRAYQLDELWRAAHMSIRGIRDAVGLTQAAFCTRFCIPKRTLENWEGGQSKCPDYLRLLLAQAVGAYIRP